MNTVTVYLGSSGHARQIFQSSAYDMGQVLADKGHNIIFGGMNAGLMGQLARGGLDRGAHVLGIIPRKLQDSERVMAGLSETLFVGDLWERKRQLFLRADTLVCLPGGYGTLDEFLEALYWGSHGLHSKQIILVNIEGYWDKIITFLETCKDFDPRFLNVVSRIQDVPAMMKSWQAWSVETPEHLPHFEDEITRKTHEPLIIDSATLENAYFAACALGLKQLAKHERPIGFLNSKRQFDLLISWFEHARHEHFITDKCLSFYDQAESHTELHAKLAQQAMTYIDLQSEKWGQQTQ
jgi:hypothetical protein